MARQPAAANGISFKDTTHSHIYSNIMAAGNAYQYTRNDHFQLSFIIAKEHSNGAG